MYQEILFSQNIAACRFSFGLSTCVKVQRSCCFISVLYTVISFFKDFISSDTWLSLNFHDYHEYTMLKMNAPSTKWNISRRTFLDHCKLILFNNKKKVLLSIMSVVIVLRKLHRSFTLLLNFHQNSVRNLQWKWFWQDLWNGNKHYYNDARLCGMRKRVCGT